MRFILAMTAVVCLSWRSAAQETTLTVYAAASLQDAFEQMGSAFETAYPDIRVAFEFGGSSGLAAQLISGAPADVFASANEKQMQNVVEAGIVAADGVTIFAQNTLTLIVPADNPANVTSAEDLQLPGIAFLTAVTGVPVRGYTEEVLIVLNDLYGSDYSAAVLNNIVSEEDNVRLIVTKIALGEGDAGIVYRTDVTPDVEQDVLEIPLPADSSPLAVYPLAVVSDSPAPEEAQLFVDFVLSAEGQQILADWKFCAAPSADQPMLEMTPEATPAMMAEMTPEPISVTGC